MSKIFVKKKLSTGNKEILLVRGFLQHLVRYFNDQTYFSEFHIDTDSKKIDIKGDFNLPFGLVFGNEFGFFPHGSIGKKEYYDLESKSLKVLLKGYAFKTIQGSFRCGDMGLNSMDGMPEYVSGSLNLKDNALTSIDELPINISPSASDNFYSFHRNRISDFPRLKNFMESESNVMLRDNYIQFFSDKSVSNFKLFLEDVESYLISNYNKAFRLYLRANNPLNKPSDLYDENCSLSYATRIVSLGGNPIVTDSEFIKTLNEFDESLQSKLRRNEGFNGFLKDVFMESGIGYNEDSVERFIKYVFRIQLEHSGKGFGAKKSNSIVIRYLKFLPIREVV